ncbi:MAG: type II toxin-antitoxin system VapC family toxin [Propionibacteriales bacterium]|nr:type II toxin-antitoxin system VapC family toxin [Propionibacteriales bacterium]
MIGLDTNVLVRALANDDPEQTRSAQAMLSELSEERPGFISLTVMTELVWVLQKVLKFEAASVHRAVDALMGASAFEIEDGESVGEALEAARRGADFPDALIAATHRLCGVTDTVTFDRAAARRFGWRLLA